MSEPRKCENCNVNRATVHFTQVIKGTFRRTHLCEDCNEAQDVITPELLESMTPAGEAPSATSTPLHLAVQLAAGHAASGDDAKSGGDAGDSSPTVMCDNCGLTFDEFKSHGRFGCADDYQVFSESLDPILKKIHGATAHVGRVPPQTDETTSAQVKIRTLETKLGEAVGGEDYEAAARLRDEIEHLQAELAAGGQDGAG